MYKTLIICFIFIICFFTQLRANENYDIQLRKSEAQLYEEAVKLFNKRKYKKSVRASQKIEDLYPFSYWAMKAKLLSGISHYNMANYSSAANNMNDYIHTYSNGEDLPYVYYIRVLSYYMQIRKIQLGQQIAYKALDLANEYINLFPDSEYTEEMKEKVKLITEFLFKKGYYIGKFYLRRGEYLAAIKRFQNVIIISNKNSIYFSKSINYLILACLALGLDLEAEQYENILADR